MKHFVNAILLVCLYNFSVAATYYVDFENGSDTNDGLTQEKAWEHCPGDDDATGVPAGKRYSNPSQQLQPGETIIFKGGVAYRSDLNWGNVRASGTEGNPITLKGNSGWGTGKAILDGGEAISNWTKCVSAADAEGNENWANMWYAYIPAAITHQAGNFNLYQDDQALFLSQYPDADDPYFINATNTFLSVHQNNMTNTSITDPRLAALGGADLVGSYVIAWKNPNVTIQRRILSYSASGPMITVEDISEGGGGIYPDRATLYSVINSNLGTVLDRAGEYYLKETQETNGTRKVLIWPYDGKDPNSVDISMSVRGRALRSRTYEYLAIEGFVIRNYNGSAVQCDPNQAIRDNDIINIGCLSNAASAAIDRGSFIEHNILRNCSGTRGIIGGGGRIAYNQVSRCGQTGIAIGTNTLVIGNYIYDNNAVHSNGMRIYYDDNVVVAHNVVVNTARPLSMQDAHNITVYGNVFAPGNKGYCMSWWNPASGPVRIINNTFYGVYQTHGHFQSLGNATSLVMKNNIVHAAIPGVSGDISHNLVTDTTGWDAVFRDYRNQDFHLTEGSSAINAGTDISSFMTAATTLFPEFDYTVDGSGTKRGADGGWDAGAYEYTASDINSRIVNPGCRVHSLHLPNPLRSFRQMQNFKGAVINLNGQTGTKTGFYLLQDIATGQVRKVVFIK